MCSVVILGVSLHEDKVNLEVDEHYPQSSSDEYELTSYQNAGPL